MCGTNYAAYDCEYKGCGFNFYSERMSYFLCSGKKIKCGIRFCHTQCLSK